MISLLRCSARSCTWCIWLLEGVWTARLRSQFCCLQRFQLSSRRGAICPWRVCKLHSWILGFYFPVSWRWISHHWRWISHQNPPWSVFFGVLQVGDGSPEGNSAGGGSASSAAVASPVMRSMKSFPAPFEVVSLSELYAEVCFLISSCMKVPAMSFAEVVVSALWTPPLLFQQLLSS